MQGLMQHWPLTVDRILDHARGAHGTREVVTRKADGRIVRTDYAGLHATARRVSEALVRIGVGQGDRVATLAWNNIHHLAFWYGTMGIGAILHTLNPRLHADQLAWMINHAGDKVLVVEEALFELVAAIAGRIPRVERIVVLGDAASPPSLADRTTNLEQFLSGADGTCSWGGFDEETAAGLCYTSGTTGDPKGVLYSHRSNVLHALAMNQPDLFCIRAHDAVMPVVPMFHANAWGLAFMAPMAGAKLILPGPKLDGSSLYELLEKEHVTITAAVPTLWEGLLAYLDRTGERLTSLKRCFIGGAAAPERLVRAFEDRHGVEVIHAWGMTELSPCGTFAVDHPALDGLELDARRAQRMKQGRAPFTVEIRIEDGHRAEVPRDGMTSGRLLVRGPAVARRYFGAASDAVDEHSYFDTGDIASLDEFGFMRITDRAKDLIKSGGEWISSSEIESLVSGHPSIERAAVIAMPDERWGERPLVVVQAADGATVEPELVAATLEGHIPNWWMPDALAVVEKLPIGPTGKIEKLGLRTLLAGGLLQLQKMRSSPPKRAENALPVGGNETGSATVSPSNDSES